VSLKRRQISRRTFLARSGVAVTGFAAGIALPARAPDDTTEEHRVNMVTWYDVDPLWPQRPAGFGTGSVPGIAVDPDDRVWVFTRSAPPIRVYDNNGEFLFAWDWPGETVKKAHYLSIDSQQNIWLADAARHVVHKCSPKGKILLTLGTPDVPGQNQNHFNGPTDIAVTPDGDIFVSDGYNNARVVHFDPKGRFIKSWGSPGIAPGQFNLVHAIALDSKGRLYVADRNNARVQVFDQHGTFLAQWRNIVIPWGITVTDTDEIWICGSSPAPWRNKDTYLGLPPKDQVLMKFDTGGKLLQLWTLPMPTAAAQSPPGLDWISDLPTASVPHDTRPGLLNWVHAITLDSQGNICLGDIMGKRVQKFIKHQSQDAQI
jgi:DNA-binding beta-propeller fold protein YncE